MQKGAEQDISAYKTESKQVKEQERSTLTVNIPQLMTDFKMLTHKSL